MATNISQAFDEFKSRLELNSTLQEAISTHHNAIREWIEGNDPDIDTELVGSLQRRTRIQPRTQDVFDMDILVVLGNAYRWMPLEEGISPSDALDKVEDIVSENSDYKRMGPETDSPTIIVEYADGTKAELIPAYRDEIGHAANGTPTLPKGRGYWIPKNNQWVIADYDYDSEYITNINQECEGWLIPVIKMLKAAKRNLFPEMQSYHLEVLAANWIFALADHYKQQGVVPSYLSLVYGFFLYGKDEIVNIAKIPSSKSSETCSYLDSHDKQRLAQKFSKIEQHCQSIILLDGREAIEGWKEVFGEPFLSYG